MQEKKNRSFLDFMSVFEAAARDGLHTIGCTCATTVTSQRASRRARRGPFQSLCDHYFPCCQICMFFSSLSLDNTVMSHLWGPPSAFLPAPHRHRSLPALSPTTVRPARLCPVRQLQSHRRFIISLPAATLSLQVPQTQRQGTLSLLNPQQRHPERRWRRSCALLGSPPQTAKHRSLSLLGQRHISAPFQLLKRSGKKLFPAVA